MLGYKHAQDLDMRAQMKSIIDPQTRVYNYTHTNLLPFCFALRRLKSLQALINKQG